MNKSNTEYSHTHKMWKNRTILKTQAFWWNMWESEYVLVRKNMQHWGTRAVLLKAGRIVCVQKSCWQNQLFRRCLVHKKSGFLLGICFIQTPGYSGILDIMIDICRLFLLSMHTKKSSNACFNKIRVSHPVWDPVVVLDHPQKENFSCCQSTFFSLQLEPCRFTVPFQGKFHSHLNLCPYRSWRQHRVLWQRLHNSSSSHVCWNAKLQLQYCLCSFCGRVCLMGLIQRNVCVE